MMALTHWISPQALRSLGLSLLHFLWQGAVLAALAAVVLPMCRKASTRYAIGVACLVAMLATPAVTYLFLSQHQEQSQPFPPSTTSLTATPSAHSQASNSATALYFSPQAAYQWLVQAWFLGVFLFTLRTAGGLVLMERMRRRETNTVGAEVLKLCVRLQNHMGIRRAIRYCETLNFSGPAVIGWFHPVVLLPLSALSGLSTAQLEAVIAHELAHIRRYDAFFNAVQVAVEALLFYHPAVWWLNKRIREERENCCDDMVVALCGSPLEYVRALTLLEASRVAPAFAMGANQGSLPARIRRLLGAPAATSGLRSASLSAGFLFLCVAAAAGHALFGTALATSEQADSPTAQTQPATQREVDFVIQATRLPTAARAPQTKPAPAPETALQQKSQEPAKPQNTAHESYIDGLKAAGLDNLSVDDLISLKVQGVTPEYVREMQAAGLKANADDLVGMKVQGITPEYVKQLRASGLQLNADDLIAMKVQGISPDYIRQLKELNLESNADSLIAMKVQHITPEYVKEIQALGLHPDADDLIGMKVQGVTPEYVKQLQAAGLKVTADDCISAKIAGVTPEFIEQVKSHGFKNLTLDQVVELKRSGVLEK
jgi:beta-lactamase regulating signal transducer with metallopeptidase domain